MNAVADVGAVDLGAVDLGGSHVAAALVGAEFALGPVVVRRFGGSAVRSAGDTLDLMAAAMVGAGRAHRWVVAAPGPFDYAGGVCWIRDQPKLRELYAVDLRAGLAERLAIETRSLSFVNDASAAALGECVAGAGHGAGCMVYLSIGTGLGSAVVRDGEVVDGDLYLEPLRGGVADAWISTGGLLRRVGDGGRADALAVRARAGECTARAAFSAMGDDLALVLRTWLDRYAPDVVVVGGGLSHALDLLLVGDLAGCGVPVVQATRPETAALIGAASAWQ